MKTLAQQFHALTVDNFPTRKTPKPGAQMLHQLAIIPPGVCRNCWKAGGRCIQLEEVCPRCQIRTPARVVAERIQKHREENK
jgi:hypothetical protein